MHHNSMEYMIRVCKYFLIPLIILLIIKVINKIVRSKHTQFAKIKTMVRDIDLINYARVPVTLSAKTAAVTMYMKLYHYINLKVIDFIEKY